MDQNKEVKNSECEVALRMPDKNEENPKSTLARIHRYFREYCNSTSIHGFKYLAESRSLGERLLWVSLITCSLSACIYLIFQIYGKFQESPLIVSFATTESPIYTVPFPAVTICPLTKARKDIFNFTDVIHKIKRKENVTDQDKRYAKYMSLICEVENDLFLNESTFTEDIFEALDEIKIPMTDVMDNCKILNAYTPCENLFYPAILDQSICYTFNMLDREFIFNKNVVHFANYNLNEQDTSGWSVDTGYFRTKGSQSTGYPIRAFLAGADNGLEITLFQNVSNNDYLCIQDVQGFSVLLHAPYSIPLLKKQYFNVGVDRAVLAAVTPRVMSTSDKVRQFKPRVRQCYFSTEKKLKYFKIYSPRNCKLECLTDFTLRACGCVSYYMPRENGTAICGNAKYKCMEVAEILLKFEILHQIEEDNDDFYCNCKPLCTDITYDVEVSASPWDFKEQLKAGNMGKNSSNNNQGHYAKLTVYFQHDAFLVSERNELYGPTDFLANFGGLLGLFTGFSLLSAAEIIYFLTVRMCCNFRLYRVWTGRGE